MRVRKLALRSVTLVNGAQMGAIEAQEGIPEIHGEIWRLESDTRALGVVERAVDAVMEATHSVVALVDAAAGIGSSAAVYEAAVSAARIAHRAIDGIHGDTELFDDPEEDESEQRVAPHIDEFWNAMGAGHRMAGGRPKPQTCGPRRSSLV